MTARPARPRAVCAALALSLAAAGTAAGAAPAPLAADGADRRFEDVTLLVGSHHAYARLAGVDDQAPPVPVEAALLPALADCARPDCDPDAPRAVAHALTVGDGGLELAFVTAGPFARRPVRLAPGERVRLRTRSGDPAAEGAFAVAALAVTDVDVAADRLRGTAPAGAGISVSANRPDGAFVFSQATAEADGAWQVELAGRLDLVPGAFGAATTAVDGTSTQAPWAAPLAVVRLGDPVVDVFARVGGRAEVDLVCPAALGPRRGTAVVWRGASEPAPVLLRRSGGSPAAAGAAGCSGVALRLDGQAVADAPLPGGLAIDVAADTITAGPDWPAGPARLRVGDVERAIDAAAGTGWRVDLAGTLDLTTTHAVEISSNDPAAAIGWSMTAYAPSITAVDAARAIVHGRGVAGQTVRLRVDGADAAEAVVAADGSWTLTARGPDGAPRPLGAATRLAVWPLPGERTASPLRAAALANRDTVAGTARPGARLRVVAAGAVVTATADAAGTFSADFGDRVDLTPGMPVAVEAAADDGYRAVLAFPVFRASVQVGGDRVVVEGHPGLAADVEVTRGGATVGRGACTIADGDTACTARARRDDGAPIVLAAGDEVVVLPNAGATVSLAVIPLTAHLDTNAFSVVGNCPPNGEMRVVFHPAEGAPAPFDATTTADGAGVCDHELSRGEWELMTPGLRADLIHARPDGHRTFATAVYEQVRRYTDGAVEGLAEPFGAITLTLGAAAPLAARADGDGRWHAAVPLTPDDLVVDDGRRRHHLPARLLAGWWLDDLGAVAGLTDPDQPVRVVHDRRACPEGPAYAVVAETADPLGAIALDGPSVAPCPAARAELAAALPGGDEVRLRLPAEVRPGAPLHLPIARR